MLSFAAMLLPTTSANNWGQQWQAQASAFASSASSQVSHLVANAQSLHHSKQPYIPPVHQGDNWKTGRATFYGLDGGSTIHQGRLPLQQASCYLSAYSIQGCMPT
jgi:hypothetical protein